MSEIPLVPIIYRTTLTSAISKTPACKTPKISDLEDINIGDGQKPSSSFRRRGKGN